MALALWDAWPLFSREGFLPPTISVLLHVGYVKSKIHISRNIFSMKRINTSPDLREYDPAIWSCSKVIHDDVIKWNHFPRYWPFVRGIHRSPVNSPHKGQWRGALKVSLICPRKNGWVNNGEAGDLRRYRVHYDVIVMYPVHYHNNIIPRIHCPWDCR